jgi:hypothetical protein
MSSLEKRKTLITKVMGFTIEEYGEKNFVAHGQDADGAATAYVVNTHDDELEWWWNPFKSTASAMEVMERMAQCGFVVRLERGGTDTPVWTCTIHDMDQSRTALVETIADTMPKAVSRAALELASKYTLEKDEEPTSGG